MLLKSDARPTHGKSPTHGKTHALHVTAFNSTGIRRLNRIKCSDPCNSYTASTIYIES